MAVAGLSGCQHKVKLAPLPPVQPPVNLEKAPTQADEPLLEVPPARLPPVPIAAAAAKPKREKKRSPKASVSASAQTPTTSTETVAATVPSPVPEPAAAIGALTAQGASSPQAMQDARDLLASIEKRLNALPSQKVEEQRPQINKVKNFWRDAQAALSSGDGEGALTLATKAKLLLDDLEK